MKKTTFFIFFYLFLRLSIFGQSTITVDAGTLADENNVNILPSGTVVLVADTAGDGFAELAPGATFSQGGYTDFVDSALGILDDLVISTSIPHGPNGAYSFLGDASNGYMFHQFNPTADAINQGLSDRTPLALMWIPSLSSVDGSLNGVTISAGSYYGVYAPTLYSPGDLASSSLNPFSTGASIVLSEGSSRWVYNSAATGGIDLVFHDNDALLYTGNISSEYGTAQFQAIPEPSTYAALLGAVGLVYVGYRRRKNKAAA